MKRLLVFIPFLLLTIFLAISISLYSRFKQCQKPINSAQLQSCLSQAIHVAKFFRSNSHADDALTLEPLLPYASALLGFDKPITYLILLQNQYELRANGGFFGSFAFITLDKAKPNIRFQDIYVPDGAIIGHVAPPPPIQQAFKQGWFRLRDSDWEPDFTIAAPTIRWFFEKGGETNPDILLTLNLATIEEIIKTLGSIQVPEYHLTIDHNNLYSLLQNQAELGFFPGSTQKKDVITAAGHAIVNRLKSAPKSTYLQILAILIKQLKSQNLLLNSLDPNIQEIFDNLSWSGQIKWQDCSNLECIKDHFMIVEANLGANKANCCVEKSIDHQITRKADQIIHEVTVNFDNSSPLENPDPPRFFGGNYISYLRLYLPENATLATISATPTLPKRLFDYPRPFTDDPTLLTLDTKFQSKEIGFFHLTTASTKSQISLTYTLPADSDNYQLEIKNQNGTHTYPSTLNLFSQFQSTKINTNQLFSKQIN